MGIGFGIARRFIQAGATVLLADLDGDAANAAASRLGSARAVAMQADVSDAATPERIVRRAVEAFGGIDILVNNAGIFPVVPMLEMAVELFDRVIAVNLRGTALLAQAVARQMVRQGSGGRIINIASVDAFHPSMVGLAAYDASKGGVLMFTRNLALELAPHEILVTAIAPGGVNTEGARALQHQLAAAAGLADQATTAGAASAIPLRRLAAPDDIALAAVFLASPASAYITGQTIVVDGGMLIA